MANYYIDENHPRYQELWEQGEWEHARAGIYGIYLEDKLVYIGKSNNMLRRWVQHMEEIEYMGATTVKYDVLRQAMKLGFQSSFKELIQVNEGGAKKLGELEGEMIRKHLPPLNQKVPKEEDWQKTTMNPNFCSSITTILGIKPKPYKFLKNFEAEEKN